MRFGCLRGTVDGNAANAREITACDRRAVLGALQASIGYMRVDTLLARADYPPSGFAVLLGLLFEGKLVRKHQRVLEADSLIRMAQVLS